MGFIWQVWAWRKFGCRDDGTFEGYHDVEVYHGDSLIKTVLATWKAKKTSGCVRMEWR